MWNRTSLRVGGILMLVGTAGGLAVRGAGAQGSVPDCVQVWGEAQYRNYGYDHVVHVANHCDATAACDVSTSVNPVPTRATVASKQTAEILTFRGSPSREFAIRAECSLID